MVNLNKLIIIIIHIGNPVNILFLVSQKGIKLIYEEFCVLDIIRSQEILRKIEKGVQNPHEATLSMQLEFPR